MAKYPHKVIFNYTITYGPGNCSDTLQWTEGLTDEEYAFFSKGLEAGTDFRDIAGLDALRTRLVESIQDEERCSIYELGLEFDCDDPFEVCSLTITVAQQQ